MLPINKHLVFDIIDLSQANPQGLIASISPSPSYKREGKKQKETRKRKKTSRKSSKNAPQKKIDLEQEVPKGETLKNIFIYNIHFFNHTSCWCACLCMYVCKGIISFVLLLLVLWPHYSKNAVLTNSGKVKMVIT